MLRLSLATLLALFAPAPVARADIFQWEYINPANPRRGKAAKHDARSRRRGANAVPGANLSGRNLTMAYLIGADLSDYSNFDDVGTYHFYTDLTDANLSQANLTNANLRWRCVERRTSPAPKCGSEVHS